MLTKENGLKILQNIEGYHQALKMIHWSTDNKSEHLLSDEIESAMLSYEDALAENFMGALDVRYGVGDLKTMLPSSSSLKDLLNEMQEDMIEFREEVGEDTKYCGIINIIDDIFTDINKWKYLATLS